MENENRYYKLNMSAIPTSMLHPCITNAFKMGFANIAIKKKETCPHWIDFRIYDFLSDELKDVYLNQFMTTQILFRPHQNKIYVMCSDLNTFSHYPRCDCSKHYKKTIKAFSKELKLTGKALLEERKKRNKG